MLNMESIFTISRRFKTTLAGYRDHQSSGRVIKRKKNQPLSGIDTDAVPEYGDEEYWSDLEKMYEDYGQDEAGELLEEVSSKLDNEKLNWKLSQAIINEIRHSGLSYLPDVIQLSLDNESSIWVRHLDKKSYEPVSQERIAAVSLDGVPDKKLGKHVNDMVANMDPDAPLPDIIVGDQNGRQVMFVVRKRGQSVIFEKANSGVIPVYLKSDDVMRVARQYYNTLKALGVQLDPDFDFSDLDRGGTLVSAPDQVPYEGPPTMDIPVEHAASEPIFNSTDLEWIARAIAFSLKNPEVQSRPEFTEALLGIFNKVQNALDQIE